MSRRAFAIVSRAVRAWVWFYTLPLDAGERDGRRRDIASDLWEYEADSGATFDAAANVLLRAILGIPDDLLWMGERLSADRHPVRPRVMARIAVGMTAVATVALSANSPALDPAQALRVNVQSVGWVRIASDASNSAAWAPAIAFTLTNRADRGTASLDVNGVFHRADEGGGALGLGTAFTPVIGWRGLDRHATSSQIVLHGQPLFMIDAKTGRALAVPVERVDEMHVRLFVHHRGQWTPLGDFSVPAQRLSR